MFEVTVAIYAEGSTDNRFLPVIIQRTCTAMLIRHDRFNIDVLFPQIIYIDKTKVDSKLDQCILDAARQAYGYHLLVIHTDGDSGNYQQARNERFEPGYDLVQQNQKNVCKILIPIIPIRMVEAWLLADLEALKEVLRISTTIRELHNLGLLEKAKEVEKYKDPKDILLQIIRKIYPRLPERRHKQILADLYEGLAPIISIERLLQVPSYQQFIRDLEVAFQTLNIIR